MPKIIAITAAAFEEERQQILAAGFDDSVAKPCSKWAVLAVLAEHLNLAYADSAARTSSQPAASPASCRLERHAPRLNCQPNYAARSANERLIFALLEEIPFAHSALKLAIDQLVDEFRLDQLVRLTRL